MTSPASLTLATNDALSKYGFKIVQPEVTGLFYHNTPGDTAILVDVGICELERYPYVDYTMRQNELMYNYDHLFRFLYATESGIDGLRCDISSVLQPAEVDTVTRQYGQKRNETAIDPTGPEARFEKAFGAAFGMRAFRCLHREYPYTDLAGKRRYVDYCLWTDSGKVAFELNGEIYHHPPLIGAKRYQSQVFKQNSLVRDGFKVFRWSARGMHDEERMIQELRTFLGDSKYFHEKPQLKFSRAQTTIKHYKHQQEMLDAIQEGRNAGKDSFLMVLPTGTGKTEIFIEDMVRVQTNREFFSALVIVPTSNLRRQTLERFRLRAPRIIPTLDPNSSEPVKVVVQTYAYLNRHYGDLEANHFDYIVVDEAHHAMAAGLRKTLEHFHPQCLLGVTATPNRLDEKKLEEMFGEYESSLSLTEAMERGLVPPVRCFRVQSNIDLTDVRFNGRDYVSSDLQKSVVVSSRDQLVADTIDHYFGGTFSNKQGVVFCVDINHAKRMAKTLNDAGISALAISGRDRSGAAQAMKAYDDGGIRFLCSCALISEGWDSPQTEILVMARPTFSQVLYTQQLGRGTRRHPGKEAFYVLDVVDNYGGRFAPLSLHALLGVSAYQPFGNVVEAPHFTDEEVLVLDGLYEGVRRIEPVEIFNYEKIYGDFLNEEQLARELFVSTGTIKTWVRKQKIVPDHVISFGQRKLHFFDPERVESIRRENGLSEHNAATRRADFIDFIKTGDYTFSYKMVFMLSFLKNRHQHGEAQLDEVTRDYQSFYQRVSARAGRCDRGASPYNRESFLAETNQVQKSLLANPFEKFERKRFMYHCKDLNYISLDGVLVDQLTDEDYGFVRDRMIEDLKSYLGVEGIGFENEDVAEF